MNRRGGELEEILLSTADSEFLDRYLADMYESYKYVINQRRDRSLIDYSRYCAHIRTLKGKKYEEILEADTKCRTKFSAVRSRVSRAASYNRRPFTQFRPPPMGTNHDKQSTVQKGNSFRDAVAELLRTRYVDVRTEIHVGHKDVDVVFTQDHLGKRIKIGVECKDYDRPLTKDYIAKEIFADYSPLVPGQLHNVLIVTRQSPNSAAQSYVDGVDWLRLQSFAQLEEELLGIRPYLRKLATVFDMDDVGRYYIEARFEGSEEPAIDMVRNWIDVSDQDSLAVLGGYGKGKTSLALRVVAEQASRHLADPTERMPILLRLGPVTQETQLEAQFGKEFTAFQQADGFRFDTLMHLNRGGRLLIVLDGFDEMKHGMSPADFDLLPEFSTGLM